MLVRYAARPALAVVAGLALWLAFPEHDVWWLAPIGVGLLAAVTVRAGFRGGFGLGLLAGWAFFVPVLSWSGVYVGALPWLALATLQALYVALMAGVVGFAGRRLLPSRPVAAYAVVPFAWVAQEWARSTTPWGGFPWARLAFSQASDPLLPLARYAGAPGLTLAVAVIGAALALSAHEIARRNIRRAVVAALVAVGIPLGMSAATGAFYPGPTPAATSDGIRVGLVQGNVPNAGLDFNAERRAVLDNHVRGTEELAGAAPGLDLVVWPENSSDIDPFRNADAAAQIQRALDAVGVPIVLGAVLTEPPGGNSNVSLLYRPGGAQPERYTKLHPVPFAEYIPYRSFFRQFTPYADLAGNFVAGDTIGVFRLQGREGPYAVLPTICFEVAYDGLMRDAVAAAGTTPSILLVQTNNATFGYTAESEQQFAISRVRAVEHGRPVVHVSTVGVSGFIDRYGRVSEKTGLFTHEVRQWSVGPESDHTPADRIGFVVEPGATLALSLLVLWALGSGRTGRRVKVDETFSPEEAARA